MHSRGCGYGTSSTLARSATCRYEWSRAHLPAIDKGTGVPMTSRICRDPDFWKSFLHWQCVYRPRGHSLRGIGDRILRQSMFFVNLHLVDCY
jgi:hypothetical protein